MPFEVPKNINLDKKKRKLVAKNGKRKQAAMKGKNDWNYDCGKHPPPQNYTGPNVHGLSILPAVKQLKTVVGGVEVETATFLKGGQLVITRKGLMKARD